MVADLAKARDAIARCSALRDKGVVEAVLRGEFQSRLRSIFPEPGDELWINHYGEGAEAHTIVGIDRDTAARRFIDNLIGFTTIEYESDLRVRAKRDKGIEQVKEHAVGLIRSGIPVSQIRGILSDTVEWNAYDVSFLYPDTKHGNCTIKDIKLIKVESFGPTADDEATAERLTLFLRRHLAREQSRPLIAVNLALDLGLESSTYRLHAGVLTDLVEAGHKDDPAIVIATDLWSRFVDHLEGDGEDFRISAYVDAVYLNILARLLSANALACKAIISGDDELKAILDGSFFRSNYQLDNLVEKDYFGWIAETTHVNGFLPVAHEIQRDLYAYDFNRRNEQDLFGQLMAQLASRSKRKLLGQEWTPSWLARHLAVRCLKDLPEGEDPNIVDMCCGSGAILVEVIKAVRDNYDDIACLIDVATGFDIDPLAVAFAKTNWVIALADKIKKADDLVTIPIYHADSLFTVTPVSASLPIFGEDKAIDITLDGERVQLPAGLLQPENRELFTRLIDWAYDEAQQVSGTPPTADQARTTLDTVAAAIKVTLSSELRAATAEAILALAHRMKKLADAGRNGIWAFILRNTYRPALLAGQFNGMVSNPPWLAMSRLADNPYRDTLSYRAALYGVRPTGQSSPHLELATTHLLHAVDHYLKPGAAIACLVPGTILNGRHHEFFRQRNYTVSERKVALLATEIWQVEPGTFNYPGAALIGRKEADATLANIPLAEGAVADPNEVRLIDLDIRKIDETRTAWVLENNGMPAATTSREEISQQGADIMPRRAVCIEILNATGSECQVDTPQPGTHWEFTVKQAKELKGESFAGYVAPRFIHCIAQSVNLLPFVFGTHKAPIAIPAYRDENDAWQILGPAEIRREGFTRTAGRFTDIDKKLEKIGDSTLACRINFRSKLTKQNFGGDGFVVLSGAGGKHICAACLPVSEAASLVIDQTLYWQVVKVEADAWFQTGILNSVALTEAIMPFNPKGNFGPRHIHTLPYRLMPPYDPDNDYHQTLVNLAQSVADKAVAIVVEDSYISDPNRTLPARRKKLREKLATCEDFQKLDWISGVILGVYAANLE